MVVSTVSLNLDRPPKLCQVPLKMASNTTTTTQEKDVEQLDMLYALVQIL
jgi:hypothetical protein